MTGGGPLDSTLSVSMYIYQQGFRFLNFGYASAIAYAAVRRDHRARVRSSSGCCARTETG